MKKILQRPAKSSKRLQEFFDRAETLVPVPGSAPLLKNGLWVPRLIADELVRHGIGTEVRPLLSRTRRVTKSSATTDSADRLDPAEHADTLDCLQELLGGTRITLIDDLVTRGSTMAGCILRLRALYPDLEVDGFALGRVETVEFEDTSEMLSPKVETVRYNPHGHPILVRS